MSKIKMVTVKHVRLSARTQLWCVMVVMVITVVEVATLNGPNVCMVKQKYNITKRVKYRAPMSVRTYEWCLSIPPRCSKWNTEMRDLTRLETEERTAEVAVCCPGYKMRDVSCVPICPSGKTGHGCSEDCPERKWGPNCVNDCQPCSDHGSCSPVTGACNCQDGWQGESCESRMSSTTTSSTTAKVEELLTKAIKTTPPITSTIPSTALVETTPAFKTTLLPITRRTSPEVALTSAISPKNTIFEGTTSVSPTLPKTFNETISTVTSVELIPSPNKSASLENVVKMERSSTNVPFTTPFLTSLEVSTKSPVLAPSQTTNTLLQTSIMKITTVEASTDLPITSTVIPKTTKNITAEGIKNNVVTETSIEKTTSTESTKTPTFVSSRATTTKALNSSQATHTATSNPIENRTEPLRETKKFIKEIHVEIKTTPVKIIKSSEASTVVQKTTTALTENPLTHEVKETTRRPEATIRYFPTTVKFKPKEIWIRPAQKGDSEIKKNLDLLKHKATNKEPVSTTPKTIIVSIIPTSVSYVTYKKIALTTAALLHTNKMNKSVEHGFTKPMSGLTTTPSTLVTNTTEKSRNVSKSNTIHRTPKILSTVTNTRNWKANGTNSMTTITNLTTSNNISTKIETKHPFKVKNVEGSNKAVNKDVKTNARTNLTTESPNDEETFHILTEPEHITAVMEGNEKDRTSVDLISVISIAGGIMMAVITVAVIIVMVERCKRPRYEDVRKINDIHMQVMIDNNDVPPPYVRSIFHTPLPDPPSSEKCHYQPISTLDRNLKQFMRPVVVQTISPIMLENFRGILECHYDHLPRRSHDFEASRKHCSIAPSIGDDEELCRLRPCSIAESTIEALKCEAKLDVIDSTTSEPLYAEIPCWRPPSEHAIEIMNLNGEAVTEL